MLAELERNTGLESRPQGGQREDGLPIFPHETARLVVCMVFREINLWLVFRDS